jgi:hypothetical protein
MAEAPVRARTHTDDSDPVIWQLTPQNLQKIWDEVFTRAAELASKERKKDLRPCRRPWATCSTRSSRCVPGCSRSTTAWPDSATMWPPNAPPSRSWLTPHGRWAATCRSQLTARVVASPPRLQTAPHTTGALRGVPAHVPAGAHQRRLRQLGLRPRHTRHHRHLGARPGAVASDADALARAQTDRHRRAGHLPQAAAHEPGQGQLPAVRADHLLPAGRDRDAARASRGQRW